MVDLATTLITQDELVHLFGDTLPIEAVNLIWSSPESTTIGEIRTKLREMAPSWRRRQAIERAIRNYFKTIDGTPLQRCSPDEHATRLREVLERAMEVTDQFWPNASPAGMPIGFRFEKQMKIKLSGIQAGAWMGESVDIVVVAQVLSPDTLALDAVAK